MPRKSLGFCGILLGLAALGCGQDEKLTPVHGQIFYHNQPLSGGTIVFTPDPDRGGHGPLACGEVGPDGRYTLHTGDTAGAIPGWHRITVAPPSPAASPGQTASPTPILDLPRKYSDPEQSGLLREIKAGKIIEQDFHLE
ncbi:MAG TPA: hypothetical protein VN688_18405 [Gemmataceae bacterium]|nr:hypothetical protein [Gemmataceae bacterium]